MLVRLADAHQLVALGVDLERRLEHLLHQLRRVEDDWRRRREAGVAAHRPVPPVALVEPANARRAEDVDHEGTPHAAQTPKVLADDLEPSDHARPGGVHVLEHLVGELQQQGHRHGARARDPLCPGEAVVLCHGANAVAGRRRRDRNPASCERRRTGDARQHMASCGPVGQERGACAPAARMCKAQRAPPASSVIRSVLAVWSMRSAPQSRLGAHGRAGAGPGAGPTPGPAELLLDAKGRVIRKPAHMALALFALSALGQTMRTIKIAQARR